MTLNLKDFNELTEEAKENLRQLAYVDIYIALNKNYINPKDYIIDEKSLKTFQESYKIVNEFKNYLQQIYEERLNSFIMNVFQNGNSSTTEESSVTGYFQNGNNH